MSSDCGTSLHFLQNHLIGDIRLRIKITVKLNSSVKIAVTDHSIFSGSMGTLSVRVANAQDFLHDMVLPAMNVPGLGRHLFQEGRWHLKA